MLEDVKLAVFQANLRLVAEGLVAKTWGNVSGIDRAAGLVVIKPSGVAYDNMKAEDMVVVSLETGEVAEGSLRPSSDTPTHLALYRAFQTIGGVVHTHSLFATAWAQARRVIPPLGTTHADYFDGPIPCTRPLTKPEIEADYEANTGKVIAERFADLNPLSLPAVLVASHGPFTWGESPDDAVDNSVYLELIARMASESLRLNPTVFPISPDLLHRHHFRKHGPNRSYGQD
jgi:L-ribulose-5-phosphate 4-epimerase